MSRSEIDQLFSKLTKDVELQMVALQKAMIDQKNRYAIYLNFLHQWRVFTVKF